MKILDLIKLAIFKAYYLASQPQFKLAWLALLFASGMAVGAVVQAHYSQYQP